MPEYEVVYGRQERPVVITGPYPTIDRAQRDADRLNTQAPTLHHWVRLVPGR